MILLNKYNIEYTNEWRDRYISSNVEYIYGLSTLTNGVTVEFV